MMRKLSLAFLLFLSILSPALAQVPAPVPALPDTERRTSYSITASTCACALNFMLLGDGTDFQNWVEVFINGARVSYNDPTYGWTITSPSGSLSSLARPVTNAILTFNAVQTGTVQIVGARRPRRTSQFSENAGVSARNLNQVITDIVSQNREIWDKTNDVTGRSMLGLPGESISTMPAAALRAGKFMYWDATGLIPQVTAAGAGSGNVVGPPSSTSGDVALWDNATGTLLRDAGGGAPNFPLVHPGAGYTIGCSNGHRLPWTDNNWCLTMDTQNWTSTDPSALLILTLAGTATAGDTVNLKFEFGSGACIAPTGCTVSYAVLAGDVAGYPASVATALANKIMTGGANAALYNSGVTNCAGGGSGGGYSGGVLIGAIACPGSGQLSFDRDARLSLKLTASVTGAATETVTVNTASCGTVCAAPWDNNPAWSTSRFVSGLAPQSGSQIFALYATSTNSANTTSISQQYGTFSNVVNNSTVGAISSKWALVTPDVNGSLNQGLYVGAGAFTVGVNDPGLDAMAAKSIWIAPTAGGNPVYQITQGTSPSRMLFSNANNDPFVFSSTGGTGFNMSPTGLVDANGAITSFAGGGTPTTGQGVTLAGGSTPVIWAYNWGTSTQLDLQLNANKFFPGTTNLTALGDSTHRWTTGFFGNLALRDTSAAFDVTMGATSSSTLTTGRALTFDVVNGARTLKLGSNLTIASDPGAVTGALKSNGTGTFSQATASDLSGLGTGVSTALGVNVGSAGAFVVNGGVLGTPSSGVATNLTGTASGLTAGNVTTNANLTGDVTSVGNAATLVTAQSAVHTWSAVQTFSNTTDASSTSTGAITTSGGISSAKRGFFNNFSVNTIGNNSWGTATTFAQIGLYYAGTLTASGGFARLWQTDATLAAAANNDELTGLRITLGVNRGAFTGTVANMIYVQPLSGAYDYIINATAAQGKIALADTTASTSKTTGSFTTAGGIGAGGATYTDTLNVITMAQTSAAQSGTVCYNSGTGLLTYDATVGCLTSTLAAKKDWKDIAPEEALSIVLKMQPGSYNYKDGLGLPIGEQIGFAAEQIARIDDRLVAYGPDDGKLRGVRYQQASVLYSGAIQALENRLTKLEAR